MSEVVLKRINALRQEIPSLKGLSVGDPKFRRWKSKYEAALERLRGEGELNEALNHQSGQIIFETFNYLEAPSPREAVQTYDRGLDEAEVLLESIIDDSSFGSVAPSQSEPKTKTRLSPELLQRIRDPKILQIAKELNDTSDGQPLLLISGFGECLKWTLFYEGQKQGSALSERTGLKALVEEAIAKPYFTDNAANRFLEEFRDNFQKSQFDMVRHSKTFVPNASAANSSISMLAHILDLVFPS